MCLLGLVSTDLGIPFILTKDKISPDIQTCYKVVSGGTAYSTLSFHDNVDTGSFKSYTSQVLLINICNKVLTKAIWQYCHLGRQKMGWFLAD